MRKRVLFIANSLDSAYKYQQVLAGLDVDVAAGSTAQIKRLLAPGTDPDLVIFEARSSALQHFDEVSTLAERLGCPLLAIVDEESIGSIRLPSPKAGDFVMSEARIEECSARVQRLLGVAPAEDHQEIIQLGNMVVNLATYQVTVGETPIDFTYLEYLLLVYFVQHPNRTFTRDVLLQNVWGVDYYGGSRTVDVHVRRVRAKLGPAQAQHLETVRGVGYLWNPGDDTGKV